MCYFAGMQKPITHPFTITVAANKPLRSTFSWTVRGRREAVRQSQAAYPTFEEARLAGKAALDELVTAWRLEALHSAAA